MIPRNNITTRLRAGLLVLCVLIVATPTAFTQTRRAQIVDPSPRVLHDDGGMAWGAGPLPWTQTEDQLLLAADGLKTDRYGNSVAIEGDVALVGALQVMRWNGPFVGTAYVVNGTGKVYVYRRAPDGTWTLEQTLTPSDGLAGDGFGASVALSGNTAIVGARGRDSASNRPGAAYVFVHDGTSWTEQATLQASDGEDDDDFGDSVDVSGDVAVVGALAQRAAYVFERAGSTWTEQAILTTASGSPNDRYADRVALSGWTIAVGAPWDDEGGTNAGAVHVFQRDPLGDWAPLAKLVPGEAFDGFGEDVALDGDTLVGGATGTGNPLPQQGSAFVFRRIDGSWVQEAEVLAEDGLGLSNGLDYPKGLAVDASGRLLVTGASNSSLWRVETDGQANEVLASPFVARVAADAVGNAFVSTGNNVQRLAPSGAVTTILDATGDGLGNGFSWGEGIAADTTGDVFVAGQQSDNVFRVETDGTITEIIDASGDGLGEVLDYPEPIAVDASGNVFVGGVQSDNVLRWSASRGVELVLDGDGLTDDIDSPQAVARDGDGNVFVASSADDEVWKLTPGGQATMILDASGDGAGNTLASPQALAVDAAGNVFVTGTNSHNVFRVEPGGAITQILDVTGDGLGNLLWTPRGVDVDASGNVFVSGHGTHNMFRVTPVGVITELIDATGDGAGNTLNNAWGVTLDAAGNAFVAGTSSDNVFKVTPGGVVSEVLDATGDGLGNSLNQPVGLDVDSDGALFVTGYASDNVFKVTAMGAVSEILDATGDGNNGLDGPWAVALEPDGDAFITGQLSDNLFQVDAAGVIFHFMDALGAGPGFPLDAPAGLAVSDVGDAYVAGSNSDNVLLRRFSGSISQVFPDIPAHPPVDGPGSLAVDDLGNLFVAGLLTDNVVRITPGGDIAQLIDATGDGLGNPLDLPQGLATDASGNLFVAGKISDNVFRVTPGGVITEILDATGDGVRPLDGPRELTTDAAGNVYVAGEVSDNVFKVTPAGVISHVLSALPHGADRFGRSVSLSGDLLLVGSDDAANTSGAAHVFKREGGAWTPGGKLKGLVQSDQDRFGDDLSITDSTALVGASDWDWYYGRTTKILFDLSGNGAAHLYEVDQPRFFLVIGDVPGTSPFVGSSHAFTTLVGPTVEDAWPTAPEHPTVFTLPVSTRAELSAAVAAQGGPGPAPAPPPPSPAWMLDGQFVVQVLMWDPVGFPDQPEQFSAGLMVQILGDGQVVSAPYGAGQGGVDLSVEVVPDSLGNPRVRFPFSVDAP